MAWVHDDAKLDRVRTLMGEQGLDAIVARAPDNVLYLTNFLGVKGSDAVVFPREGEPTLFCVEASADDAARTAWTSDVQLVNGYLADDPRPPVVRTLELAAALAREHGTLGSSCPSAPRPPTGWRRADDVHEGLVRRVPRRRDATPALVAARTRKTAQEIERMRLANEIAAAAMDHARGVIRAGMTEAQIAAEWLGFVHGEGTGWGGKVELALGFSLVWAGRGIQTFTATSNLPGRRWRADALRDLGLCRRLLGRPHEEPRCRRAHRSLPRARGGSPQRCTTTRSPSASRARASPSLDRRIREGIERIGYPGQPSHPICHGVGARAHEPPYPHQASRRRAPGGHGACNRARVLLGRRRRPACRGQLPHHRGRGGEALPVPRRSRAGMTLDRAKVWTGSVNEQALDPQSRTTVGLYDTTLRDGEQTIGVVLAPDEKLEIAQALDAAGIDRIEAGFPRVSADDFEAVKAIAAAGLKAEVWGFSRAVQADVDVLVELGVGASVIESPISDGKLDALGVSRETMLERIRSAVAFATEHGIRVAFFGVDSSRADLEFFDRAYEAAVEAGAAEAVVVDTLGIATPEAAAFLVSRALDRLDVPVHWHGHDDFGLGTAAAIAAVQAGATWVQGTVNGMGERAGTPISSRSRSRSRRCTGSRPASI